MSQSQLELMEKTFKRIFAMPISKMTLREVQDAIRNIFKEDANSTNSVYASLLSGEIDTKLSSNGQLKELEKIIENYSPSVRLAKEVAEMGEFMNSFSCDFIQQGNQVFFGNRMRRLDGQEYYFLSAPETNIRLAHMFINRLRDLKKASQGTLNIDQNLRNELDSIKADIDLFLEN
ncbi:MAG: DUF5414 family protein [Candidatus Protochlamydia sp.]|nr:DUF5414 family protein [Candidatus Protochlamydia sp.]